MSAVRRSLVGPRAWAAQLSVPARHRACGLLDTVAALRCANADRASATVPSPAARKVARDVAASLREAPTADALHAAALLDFAAGDTTGTVLDRAISYLEMSIRLAPRSATAYVDLAAARLASAPGRGGARALVRGLDAATRALALEPRSPAARYDQALALDLLGLTHEARGAWSAYLALDSSSGYAAEARRRRDALAPRARVVMPDDATPERARAYADSAPAEARTLAWERLLPEWGDAALVGDSARAQRRLAAAAAIGDALAARWSDGSIAGAVRSIRQATRRPATRELATLHAAFARALAARQRNDYAPADSVFRAVLAARPTSPVLVASAALEHANALLYDRRPDDARRAVDSLFAATRQSTLTPLAARAAWIGAVLRLRELRTADGLALVRQARELFERCGDAEYVAAAHGIVGEAQLQGTEREAGYAAINGALRELRPYPVSLWRHNWLLVLSRAATRDGALAAARVIEDEDLVAAGAGVRAVSVVEARLDRARRLWIEGHTAEADAARREAEHMLATLPSGDARLQLGHDRDVLIATTALRARPREARALLDSVVAFLEASPRPSKLIPALVARATAEIALRDAPAAQRDLERAAATYAAARDDIARAAQGRSLLVEAAGAFDALTMLHVRAGRPGLALAMTEARREAFSLGASSNDRPRRATHATAMPPAVVYAVIGDTLLTWIVRDRDTTFVPALIDRRRLTHAVENVRAAFELRAGATGVRPELDWLYDRLWRRAAAALGDAGSRVVVVADGDIARLPFAALHDARSGEYLVQRSAVSFARSLSERAPSPGPHPVGDTAVFVAVPVAEGTPFRWLPQLPGVRTEVALASREYPHASRVDTSEVDSAYVASALASATLFHFAGHAIFDEVDPDRSLLVVPPRGLTAAAIARLDLRRLRLVVLSACETARAIDPDDDGRLGLAGAFLAAGAGGVIGSDWRVTDEQAREIMEAFHRQYRRTGDAAGALRQAQRDALGTGMPPSGWAAFRYVGR